MAFAKVQTSFGIHTIQVPGAVTLGSAPTPNNWLVAKIGVNESSWTVGAGWVQFDAVSNEETTSPTNIVMLRRLVQIGDTATLPAFMSAGTTYWTHEVYELSGGSGVWADDFLWGAPLSDAVSNQALPPKRAFLNGSIALLFSASYNGNSNPSVTGSWTMDDTGNNNANYGSASGSHRLMNAGDQIDGTLTQGTSAPYAAYVMMMTPSVPTMERVRRGYSLTASSAGTPGAITLPFVPEQSGLILVALGWSDGGAASPTLGGSWTELASASGGTGKMLILAGRYVQVGDTETLPTLVTSGSQFYTLDILELAGVQGTFAVDNKSNKTGWQASGSTITTTSDSTTTNEELALLFYINALGAFGYSSTTGFDFYQKMDFSTTPSRRSWFAAAGEVATSGATVQGVVTAANAGLPSAYIQALFSNAAATPPFVPMFRQRLVRPRRRVVRPRSRLGAIVLARIPSFFWFVE